MAERRLREDLYFRLNAFTMTIPPLRERRQEIPLLLTCFMNNLAEKLGKSPLPLSDRLVQECVRYYWPGNLRELGNFVKRYLVLEQEDLVLDELQAKPSGSDPCDGFPVSAHARGGLKALVRSLKEDAEAKEIQKALDNNNWNRRAAAAELSISYKALLYKIKQHELSPASSDAPLFAAGAISLASGPGK
jgi:DNA-binding NtrC family response regulator